MNKPTVLRNSAEPEVVIGIALKIYYNQNDWVSNAVFLDELDREYDAAGKERESRSGGQMIAKYKPALYYGLLDCRPEDDCKRINEYGKNTMRHTFPAIKIKWLIVCYMLFLFKNLDGIMLQCPSLTLTLSLRKYIWFLPSAKWYK